MRANQDLKLAPLQRLTCALRDQCRPHAQILTEKLVAVASVNMVEIAGGLEVTIGQAAWGGTSWVWLGVASVSISGGTSSAMASTCM